MNDTERSACIDRCWEAALREIDDRAAPIDARSLERERARTRRLMSRLLELESQRAPFRVAALEQELPIQWSGAGLIMRVDRIDELTDGSKLLIDYKGGRAGSIRLEQDEPRPIQLAAYAAALAARGTPVQGVALLSLHPAQMRFSGRAADTDAAPSGLKPMPAWNNEVLRWCGVVEALLRAHLAGDARVAPAAGACRGCHLPSFCRIRPGGERLDEEADTEGGAQ
jgi:ATP-dependent helicase/nuclease subunit B